MKFAVFAVAVIALVLACEANRGRDFDMSYTFEEFLAEHPEVTVVPAEYEMRKALFAQRLAEAVAHNADETQTWWKAMNKFSVMTDEERQVRLGLKRGAPKPMRSAVPHTPSGKPIPPAFDWRTAYPPVLSTIRDQGQCGSCWAHGTAEALSSAVAILTGKVHMLSVQMVMETPNPDECGGTGGCGGGTSQLAYDYIINGPFNGGLATEWTYPYLSYFGENQPALNNSSPRKKPVVWVESFVQLPDNEEEPLLDAVANNGPVAVSVDASSWFSYGGGIYNGCNQTAPTLDHVVNLVGYTETYYIVRNSWGSDYGESGYIYLARPSTVPCGVDPNPLDGNGCAKGPHPAPPTQKVCGTCGILAGSNYPIAKAQPAH